LLVFNDQVKGISDDESDDETDDETDDDERTTRTRQASTGTRNNQTKRRSALVGVGRRRTLDIADGVLVEVAGELQDTCVSGEVR
jgi:hypothetical protein